MNYQQQQAEEHAKLQAVLAMPLPATKDDVGVVGFFDPWEDVIKGIYGNYSSECDDLMIATMEAVRDGKTFDLIKEKGFAAEFMLYVLAGHGLTEYGTSPRGAWPEHRELWQPLIDKWKAYRAVAWAE
jgi:hypothetical protein